MIGQTLGHYRIESKLGEGGMGVVYRALDTHLDRPVAIKVLSAEAVSRPDRKARFVQEAKAASALNHPNILHIYDIDSANAIDFIAMEFVPGKTLEPLISRRGLSLTETLKYSVQIADALAKAHSAGIVHRDLKPANIMVTDDGHVKVLDFGLAKLAESSDDDGAAVTLDRSPRTEEGAILGTVAYMSPEQAEGKKVDARSDIFSFGSVLYEMVTGRRPFQGETKFSTLTAITRDEPKPASEVASGIPPELERVIVRCLRKDPARRFQHMDDLKVALEELKEESGSGSTIARPQPASERHKRNRWIVAAVLLLAIGGVAARWFLRRSAPELEAPLRIVPLTSFAGLELEPALSPDGNQVAFIWRGEKQDNWDIYVKLIDGGTPLRLTTDPAVDAAPAWAPDGRRLAFIRSSQNSSGIYVIPALGGPERKLAEVPASKLSWSPDGKLIAFDQRPAPGQQSGIFVLSTDTGEKRRLTSTPEGYLSDLGPAFSPDGRSLVFARFQSVVTAALYLMPLTAAAAPAGEPRRLTPENMNVSAHDWIPDGRSLVFAAAPSGGSSRLWRVSAEGGPGEPQRIAVEGDRVDSPSVSKGGAAGSYRLAYVQYSSDTNIWRVPGPAVRAKDATARAASPVQLIASSRPDGAPQVSPDGKRIAFVSGRSGNNEVWVCESDGSRPVQVTSLGTYLGSPRWSPEGQRIAFDVNQDGQSDIYTISAEGGAPRRLTFEKSNEFRPNWSGDGRWIYFGSNRTGTDQIWKMPSDGGAAIQVTKNGGHDVYESVDGKFIYYSKRFLAADPPGIYRIPADGGDEVRVLDQGSVGRWAITRTGIYLLKNATPSESASIEYYNFDTGKLTEIVRFGKQAAVGPGGGTNLAVAPDDRWIVYVQRDREESDIMMIENFR